MLVQLDDYALVGDLCAHFGRSGFTAETGRGRSDRGFLVGRILRIRSDGRLSFTLQVWNGLILEATAETAL